MDPTDDARDRLQLRQLAERYARGADLRDAEMFADVFTDDATLVTARGEITGRADLLEVAPRLAKYRVTMHLVGNHAVELTGDDAASGSVYCAASHVYAVDGGDRVYVMNIRYDDQYVRVDGEWRIARRQLNLLWDEDRPLRLT